MLNANSPHAKNGYKPECHLSHRCVGERCTCKAATRGPSYEDSYNEDCRAKWTLKLWYREGIKLQAFELVRDRPEDY